MTDAQMWAITIRLLFVAVIVGGGGYLYVSRISRKFDRRYGDHRSPAE